MNLYQLILILLIPNSICIAQHGHEAYMKTDFYKNLRVISADSVSNETEISQTVHLSDSTDQQADELVNTVTHDDSHLTKDYIDRSKYVYYNLKQRPVLKSCIQENLTEQVAWECTQQKIKALMGEYTIYPPQAIENKTEGIIYDRVIISSGGRIERMKKNLEGHPVLAHSTKRAIHKLMSQNMQWRPVRKDGETVYVALTIVTRFSLLEEGDSLKPIIESSVGGINK